MEKIKEVKYELVAIFKDTEIKWEFDTLNEAKEQYESAKKYKGVKDLKCNQITTTIMNLF